MDMTQVTGDQWPIFLYVNYMYDADRLWNGLLRSGLLVCVCFGIHSQPKQADLLILGLQAHVHIAKFHRQ